MNALRLDGRNEPQEPRPPSSTAAPVRSATTFSLTRFQGVADALGISDAEPAFRRLEQLYAEPHRRYHNARHVSDCLLLLDRFRHLAERPDELGMAIWYHDSIYDTLRHDNEERSAMLLANDLCPRGLAEQACSRIVDLVRATAHKDGPPADQDQRLILDIDLAILGQDPLVFDAYDMGIRLEYSWVKLEEFNSIRAGILETFLKRDAIYLTKPFQEAFEQQATLNLKRTIQRLRR